MGGDIEVDSAPGVGSCFWFSLPLEVAAKEDVGVRSLPQDKAGSADSLLELLGGRLLLVDDNRVNQQLASAMLKKLNLPHDIANNGCEALEMMIANSYQAVLMDMEMPEMDGLTATATWREREASLKAKRLPIIAMTANAMREDRERCFEVGMDGYIAKPINMTTLGRELRRVLQLFGAVPKAVVRDEASAMTVDSVAPVVTAAPAPVKPSAAATLAENPVESVETGFDRAAALAMLDDEELFAELAGLFVVGTPDYLSELDISLANSDWPRLARAGHTLKGLFGTFVAPKAEADARRLEMAAHAGDVASCPALAARVRAQAVALSEILAAPVVRS
jgi:CheY-like chemotaxis protein